eukprot:gene7429-biopygen19557
MSPPRPLWTTLPLPFAAILRSHLMALVSTPNLAQSRSLPFGHGHTSLPVRAAAATRSRAFPMNAQSCVTLAGALPLEAARAIPAAIQTSLPPTRHVSTLPPNWPGASL